MTKVLLIGANGFLGKHLKRHLSASGYEVKAVSRRGDADYKVDIGYAEQWDNVDYSPEIIINCATVLPGGKIDDPEYAKKLLHTNFCGTYNLSTWAAKTSSVNYILNVSTLAVVNKPWPVPLTEEAPTYPTGAHALYSLSKLNQEIILNSFPFGRKIKVAHARLSALFGDGMAWNGIMCSLIDRTLNNEAITLTNGSKVSADFLYVQDACRYLGAVLEREFEGIINIASGEETYLSDLALKVLTLVGGDASQFSNTDNTDLYNRAVVDITKLKALCSNSANTDFSIALRKTIEFRKQNIVLN